MNQIQDIPTIADLGFLFENVVVVLLGLGAVIFFIMLVMGGFKILTAGADPQKTQVAQKTITTAIGGMILIIFSYFIIAVIQEITGAPIVNFSVTNP